jgi:hypothetical protein
MILAMRGQCPLVRLCASDEAVLIEPWQVVCEGRNVEGLVSQRHVEKSPGQKAGAIRSTSCHSLRTEYSVIKCNALSSRSGGTLGRPVRL